MSEDLIGRRLGPYRLTNVIGRGGMATVYKAYQPALDRDVAIKVLLRTQDPQFVIRFKREALAIARLQHHNILAVHDYGEQDGLLYLVLQYVENGTTLADLLGSPMAPVPALRLIGRVLDGLDYAHRRSVIHRDIKPTNILLTAARWPMLADFGIAKLLDDSQFFTQTGLIIGTAAYMAPEQAFGRPVDGRTDLYATGVVLYELLTGRVPFNADTPVAVLHQHAYEPPPRARDLNPDLPAVLDAVLQRALEKAPSARFQTAAEMGAELERVAAQIERFRLPSDTTALYRSGLAAFEVGRWDEATELLSQVVARDPSNEDAASLLEVAQAAHQQARAEARRRIEQAREGQNSAAQPQPAPSVQPTADAQITHRLGADPAPLTSVTSQQESPIADGELTVLGDQGSRASSDTITALPANKRRFWLAAGGIVALLALPLAFLLQRGSSPSQAISTITAVPIVVAAPSPTAVPAATPSATTQRSVAATSIAQASPTATATPTPSATSSPLPSPTSPPPDAVVNIQRLNLRSRPDTQSPSLGLYTEGTTLRVIGKTPAGDWLQVQMPGNRTGWVFAAYLQINIATTDIPIVTPPPQPTPRPRTPTTKPATPVRPAPPTDTPAPSIDTPVPPAPSTDTPVPPAPPTDTPVPPEPPTDTPAPPTPIPDPPTPTPIP